MKKLLLLLFLSAILKHSIAGDIDTSVSLDLLQSPQSPAANFIGITASDIISISDPSAFSISLFEGTTSFGKLPLNFGIDIAPAWAFGGRKITAYNFLDTVTTRPKLQKIKNAMWQNMVISTAIKNTKTEDNSGDLTQLAFGMKLVFARGNINSEIKDKYIASKRLLEKTFNEYDYIYSKLKDESGIIMLLKHDFLKCQNDSCRNVILEAIDKENENIKKSDLLKDLINQDKSDSLTAISNSLRLEDFKRYGFKAELNAAFALDFVNSVAHSRKISKGGIWFTLGYDGFGKMNREKEAKNIGSGAIYSIIRYQYNPDKLFATDTTIKIANLHTLDAGLRFIYVYNKFSTSIEGLFRSVLNNKSIKPTWRLTFNASYKVYKNMKIEIALGRNFDKTFTKNGNLIAAISYFVGFGNRRNVMPAK